MNELHVYILYNGDEVYLGTVGEINGVCESEGEGGGFGLSPISAIRDIINDIAFGYELTATGIFSIELRR